MNTSKAIMIAMVLAAGLFVITSCGKAPAENNTPGEHSVMEQPAADNTMEAPAITQKTCPVMGGAINKDIFVEYKGQKIYFCCNGCPSVFNKDPEKYMAKLNAPQNENNMNMEDHSMHEH